MNKKEINCKTPLTCITSKIPLRVFKLNLSIQSDKVLSSKYVKEVLSMWISCYILDSCS